VLIRLRGGAVGLAAIGGALWRHRAARALILDLVLTAALFYKVWPDLRTSWIGGCCDPEQAMWFLRWTPYSISHGESLLFTHHLNYPDGVNLMWNTAMTLPGLLLWPFTTAWGPLLAYNLLVTLGVALSAWCAYLAIRRYTAGDLGAVIGGLLYGFSPYMLSHALGHGPLVVSMFPPLMLMVLDEVVVRRRRSPLVMGALVGVLSAAQLLTWEEGLVLEVMGAAILLAALALTHRQLIRERIGDLLVALGAAIPVFFFICIWPLHEQFYGAQRLQSAVQPPDRFVTDLLNFVVPSRVQWIAPPGARNIATHFTGLDLEHNAYVGIPLLIVLGFLAIRRWSQPVVRAATLTILGTALLSMGPHLHVDGRVTGVWLPWNAIARLPLMADVLPSRLALIMFLGIAVLLAIFVDEVAGPDRYKGALRGMAVAAVALVPLLPSLPFPRTVATIPPFFAHWERSGVQEGRVVLIAPFIRDGGEADPMLWQAVAGDRFRMPQGYYYIPGARGATIYGAIPSTLSDAMEEIQESGVVIKFEGEALQGAAQDLRDRGVDTIIVGPMTHRAEMVRFFELLLGRPPEERDGVQIWRDVGAAVAERSNGVGRSLGQLDQVRKG
jgi:hypothetical protein